MRMGARCLLLAVLLLLAASPVRAEVIRFRFVPANGAAQADALKQVPAGPDGALGEWKTWVGGTPKPFHIPYPANRMVTFRQPYTGKNVVVPMKLPDSAPRVERISDRIRFNYGSYYVEARFLPDGGVDVIYNTGFLRGFPQ